LAPAEYKKWSKSKKQTLLRNTDVLSTDCDWKKQVIFYNKLIFQKNAFDVPIFDVNLHNAKKRNRIITHDFFIATGARDQDD
jgi:predicted HD phosphohydrolase